MLCLKIKKNYIWYKYLKLKYKFWLTTKGSEFIKSTFGIC